MRMISIARGISMLFLLLLLFSSFSMAQTRHPNKLVERILSPDERPCLFFMLQEVAVSDPVMKIRWFAVPQDHLGYKEIYTMLLLAKATGKPVSVETTGELACDLPGVRHIELEP